MQRNQSSTNQLGQQSGVRDCEKRVEPGGIVAEAGKALWGMLEYSTAELVDG